MPAKTSNANTQCVSEISFSRSSVDQHINYRLYMFCTWGDDGAAALRLSDGSVEQVKAFSPHNGCVIEYVNISRSA